MEEKTEQHKPAVGEEAPRIERNAHGSGSIRRHPVWLRLLLVALVLAAGVVSMNVLAAFRQPPEAVVPQLPEVTVNAIAVKRQDVPTVLRGYGTARSFRTSRLAPEVAGEVIEVHPRLDVGNVIERGEVLFRINPADYEIALEQARSDLAHLEQELALLAIREANNQRRLDVQREMYALAERDFQRIDELVKRGGAESEARLDQETMRLRQEEDKVIALESTQSLFENQRRQLEAQIESASARVRRAELDLRRTTVRAPFTARIDEKRVEINQRVAPGEIVVALADDSVLEIPVSLEGPDVSRWLGVRAMPGQDHWFDNFDPRPVKVQWTERPGEVVYLGRLARVESYDSMSRTFTVVVEVSSNETSEGVLADFPLVQGMFCEVEIPGRVAEGVVPVPRTSLASLNTVLVSRGEKLATQQVKIARLQGDVALISEGLETGDIVLTSRPAQIIDGLKISVRMLASDTVIALDK